MQKNRPILIERIKNDLRLLRWDSNHSNDHQGAYLLEKLRFSLIFAEFHTNNASGDR